MIRVAIIDDHAIVRAGLRQYFSDQVDLQVVAEASNGREAVDIVRKGNVDVLVMDLSMPDQSGVDALAAIKARAPVHPLRFRGNLYVTGWPAWREFDLLNQEIAIGGTARLRIVKRIVRCAATNVDPDTGQRDMTIPQTIRTAFGHEDCGIYGEVISAGTVASGDAIV